jgi:hypothetical protein
MIMTPKHPSSPDSGSVGRRSGSWWRVAINFSSVVVFAVCYRLTGNMMAAIGALVVASAAAVVAGLILERTVAPLPFVLGLVPTVTGTFSLLDGARRDRNIPRSVTHRPRDQASMASKTESAPRTVTTRRYAIDARSLPQRLDQIMRDCEAAGIIVANPHAYTLEDGSRRHKRVDADRLGFEHELDPLALRNLGKMRSFIPRLPGALH